MICSPVPVVTHAADILSPSTERWLPDQSPLPRQAADPVRPLVFMAIPPLDTPATRHLSKSAQIPPIVSPLPPSRLLLLSLCRFDVDDEEDDEKDEEELEEEDDEEELEEEEVVEEDTAETVEAVNEATICEYLSHCDF